MDWLAAKSNFTYNSLFVSKHIDSIDFKFHTFSFSFVAPNEKDQVTYGSLTAEINDLLNQVNSINYHQNECFTRSIETMNLSRSLNDPRGEPFKESFQRQDKKKNPTNLFFFFFFFFFYEFAGCWVEKESGCEHLRIGTDCWTSGKDWHVVSTEDCPQKVRKRRFRGGESPLGHNLAAPERCTPPSFFQCFLGG